MNTKTESYHKVDFKSKLQRRIYYYLKAFPNKSSQEIADVLHLRRTTVIARLNELKQMSLIEVSEIKENRNTRRKNEYYSVVTDFDSALDAVQLKMSLLQNNLRRLEIDCDGITFTVTRNLIIKEIAKGKNQAKELDRAEKILTQLIQNEEKVNDDNWESLRRKGLDKKLIKW